MSALLLEKRERKGDEENVAGDRRGPWRLQIETPPGEESSLTLHRLGGGRSRRREHLKGRR